MPPATCETVSDCDYVRASCRATWAELHTQPVSWPLVATAVWSTLASASADEPGREPIQAYLWTLKFEFHVIFRCHEVFFWFFYPPSHLEMGHAEISSGLDLACRSQLEDPCSRTFRKRSTRVALRQPFLLPQQHYHCRTRTDFSSSPAMRVIFNVPVTHCRAALSKICMPCFLKIVFKSSLNSTSF